RAENALQQELRKKTELLMSKDAAFKELRENLTGRVYTLENQLNDNEKLLRERDKELETLKVQLTMTGAAKNQVESSLAEELRKERETLHAKESAIKEMEKEWSGKLHDLETRMDEQKEMLKARHIDK